ncbi:MAG: ABC transporter ATP-binding protein [Actinomycetia bacterium]|nr:ABC transporter ATP-binding protein [Actinomycetes bacterium]
MESRGSGGRITTPAIEIRNLKKVYKGLRGRPTVAVESLDLDVPRGGVFGFLGPNGAGKTTTIRCLLGLVMPTEGSVRLLDQDIPGGLSDVMSNVGALVESPKFFPGFSGRLNLELLASSGQLDTSDVTRALDEVGLTDRANDKFGTYSLGMKQRLAVAGAILKSPELLVLDEPANGLDPAGIKDMRELIRRYGDSGGTVLVSSHQLSEIQLMCDAVAIISRGKLITAGPVSEVMANHEGSLVVVIDDPIDAIGTLAAAGFVARLGGDPDTIVVDVNEFEAANVTRTLALDGRYLRGLTVHAASLESVFLELTSEEEDPA